MQTINKVLRLGTIETYGGSYMSVFVKVKFDGKRLSISGVEGPTHGGNAKGSCGQITISPQTYNKYAPGWDKAKASMLQKLWDRWHLNDMRAGCEHQRAEKWDKKRLSEPCPTCGYKYGTAWLTEEVPPDVIDWLQCLPETDRKPAWV